MKPYISKKNIRFFSGNVNSYNDYITSEEPLEIRLVNDGKVYPVSVIMRTPVDDFPLALGFLFNEGTVKLNDYIAMDYDKNAKVNERNNIINVSVKNINKELINERNFYVNSSCGVCGKTNIDSVFIRNPEIIRIREMIEPDLILSLPDKMKDNQKIFKYTGGIHAAAIFDYSGNLLNISEDIGRHNAVDKSIGKFLLNGVGRKEDTIMQVSGRAGFEIVQKAAMFGVSVISSVSAPSSLAIELAETFNITLISFVRNNRFNIYTKPERINV